MESLGQWLREQRETRGVSIDEIASATKIVSRYLEALENDRLDIMPGGFFIKGIIRTYATAVGLDPEEVLERYRSAGLLGGPERGRSVPARSIEPIMPLIEPVPEAAPPIAPAAAAEPLEPAASPPGKGEPALLFEDTAKTGPSPEVRKKILAWVWRGLAILVVFSAVFLVLRPGRRSPGPSSEPATSAAQSLLPQELKTDPGTAPGAAVQPDAGAAAPSSQTSVVPPPETQAPAVVETAEKGLRIEIDFRDETWIRVYADGELKVDGLFPAGATARAQAEGRLVIHTGNAGGFTFRLNGRPAKPLGRTGQVLTDVLITPENVKDFLEVPSSPSGPPPA